MSHWIRWPAERVALVPHALGRAWQAAVRSARLAVGIPDYEAYVAHLRSRHPDRVPMTRAEFHRERMQARYGRGRSRCC